MSEKRGRGRMTARTVLFVPTIPRPAPMTNQPAGDLCLLLLAPACHLCAAQAATSAHSRHWTTHPKPHHAHPTPTSRTSRCKTRWPHLA